MKFTEVAIEELEKVLQSVKKQNSKFYVWNYVNNSVVKAEVYLVGLNRLKKQITCKPIESSSYYLSEMITGSGKLNFFIPEKSIYFISEIKILTEELTILWPEKIFMGDRRVKERSTNLEQNLEIDFEYDKKRYKKNCFDIGVGGISFILSQNEPIKFKIDDVIPFINIYIKKEKMEVSGKIISIEKIDPEMNRKYFYKVTRVSLRFVEPDIKTLNKIKSFMDKFSVNTN